jgi:hypothetical protein
MTIFKTYKLVNEETFDGLYFLNFCDAKADVERRNVRESKVYEMYKLRRRIKGKIIEKLHQDHWRIEEIYVLE